jgi:hypothetical protein
MVINIMPIATMFINAASGMLRAGVRERSGRPPIGRKVSSKHTG